MDVLQFEFFFTVFFLVFFCKVGVFFVKKKHPLYKKKRETKGVRC